MTTFRFGIMGAGNIAANFCRAVNLIEDCCVAAAASKSLEKAAAFSKANQAAAKGGCIAAYDSYEEMLRKEKLDCVYIATVPNSHYELAKLCLEYGVPVLCEKAFFLNSRDAKEIFALSEAKNVFVMEATWSRYLPANRKVVEWIRSGRIGKLREMAIEVGWQPGENSRQYSRELGGGAMSDLTIYSYELADFYAGREEQEITARAIFQNGVDIINRVVLDYGDMAAQLAGSIVSSYQESAVLYGDLGKIVVLQPHMARKATLYPNQGEPEEWVDEETENGFVYEILDVMDCIRKGKRQSSVVPQELTLRCAKLADMIEDCRKD